MCQIRTISYVCEHTCSFRLSKCRGTRTHIKLKSRVEVASCAGYADFYFYSTQECGFCTKAKVEQQLDEKIAALSLKTPSDDWTAEEEPESDELIAAREAYDQRLYELNKNIPSGRSKMTKRPTKSLVKTGIVRRESKLKFEVFPEDVVVSSDTAEGTQTTWDWYDQSWNDSTGDWKSLEEELAEDVEAQADACVLPPASYDFCDVQQRLDEEYSNGAEVAETAKGGELPESTAESQRVCSRSGTSRTCRDTGSRIDEKVEPKDNTMGEYSAFGVLESMLAVR